MEKGSLGLKFTDRTVPLDLIFESTDKLTDNSNPKIPFAAKIFGNAGVEHMKK